MSDQSVFTQGLSKWPRMVVCILAMVMVASSAYLTAHYYELHFPTGFSSGALCDISGFWNCDVAALSEFGQFFQIPTSVFGLVWGTLLFVSTLLRRPRIDSTNYLLSLLNAVGCLLLLGYSLKFLHGLCPGCTIYYASSILVALVFTWQLRGAFQVHLAAAGVYAIALVAVCVGVRLYHQDRFVRQSELGDQAVKDFLASPDYGVYSIAAPHYFETGVSDPANAKLKVLLFSDFECPACQVLAEMMPKIAARYWGQVSIGYVYFPLDSDCNPYVSSKVHPHACLAARMAYCSAHNFDTVHDELYRSQNLFSQSWFDKKATEYGLGPCFYSDASGEAVRKTITDAQRFEIGATPTMIVNGHKIDGLLPIKFLFMLLDGALAALDA